MSDWTDSAVFYHIYPLGFCGAPRNNEGGEPVSRILKVIDWIDHLKEMNINAVYFGPVFESAQHGYDTSDYTKIDRRLGTNADFAKVCRALHENGIRVVLDGVFNHVGRSFWAFRDVQEKGASSPYCGWFSNLNFGGNSPMGDSFWYEGWEGHFELVKLNLKNPDVVNHIFNAIDGWVSEFGIDGIRFDVAYCLDFDFLRAVHNHCKSKYDDFWLMGEVVHGDYSRWANNEMLDSVTNYECYKGLYSSINDKNYFEIAHSIRRLIGDGGIVADKKLYNFVDNHDVDRVASRLAVPESIYNLYTLLFTMPGCPSVYYGSEWALADKKDGSDYPLRPCIDLDKMQPHPLVKHISLLADAKRSLAALQNGRIEQLHLGNREFAFKRTGGGSDVFVLLNINDSEYIFNFDHGTDMLVDILTGEAFDRTTAILVKPYCGRVLVSSSVAKMPAEQRSAVSDITPREEPEQSAADVSDAAEPGASKADERDAHTEAQQPKVSQNEIDVPGEQKRYDLPHAPVKNHPFERTILGGIQFHNSGAVSLEFQHPVTGALSGFITCANTTLFSKTSGTSLPALAENILAENGTLTVKCRNGAVIKIECESIQ